MEELPSGSRNFELMLSSPSMVSRPSLIERVPRAGPNFTGAGTNATTGNAAQTATGNGENCTNGGALVGNTGESNGQNNTTDSMNTAQLSVGPTVTSVHAGTINIAPAKSMNNRVSGMRNLILLLML